MTIVQRKDLSAISATDLALSKEEEEAAVAEEEEEEEEDGSLPSNS